jgi:hypothetical protein
MSENRQSLLQSALRYAARGWDCFPVHSLDDDGNCTCRKKGNCEKPAKHPAIRWGSAATANPEQIERWWRQAKHNIAVATGPRSRLFVVDIDGEAGESSLQNLIREHGDLPTTLTSRTGKGRHIFFQHPGRVVKTNAGVLGKGIDIRADGGYVVLPPSRHASGKRYRWEDEKAPIAIAPAWLLDAVISKRGRPAAATGEEILEGERNSSLFRAASYLRGIGNDVTAIETVLHEMNSLRCHPPLPDAEVKGIAENVARRYECGKSKGTFGFGMKSPLYWFPFDTNVWCGDQHVTCMNDRQVGWYIWLLVHCWKGRGVLPNDPQILHSLAHATDPQQFAEESSQVLRAFEVSDDKMQIVHRSFRAMWYEKLDYASKNSNNGRNNKRELGEIPDFGEIPIEDCDNTRTA